jgi:hypothetical protein
MRIHESPLAQHHRWVDTATIGQHQLPHQQRGTRAYCLASELDVPLDALLLELHDLGLRGCTPSSVLDEDVAVLLRARFAEHATHRHS